MCRIHLWCLPLHNAVGFINCCIYNPCWKVNWSVHEERMPLFIANKGLWAFEQMHQMTFYHLYICFIYGVLISHIMHSAFIFLHSNFETWSYLSKTTGNITTSIFCKGWSLHTLSKQNGSNSYTNNFPNPVGTLRKKNFPSGGSVQKIAVQVWCSHSQAYLSVLNSIGKKRWILRYIYPHPRFCSLYLCAYNTKSIGGLDTQYGMGSQRIYHATCTSNCCPISYQQNLIGQSPAQLMTSARPSLKLSSPCDWLFAHGKGRQTNSFNLTY